MEGITNWIGTHWGTNRGTILFQLERKDDMVSGFIRILEPGAVVIRASIKGVWDQNSVKAFLSAFADDANNALVQGPTSGTLSGTFDATESTLKGSWTTDTGASGEFVAVLGVNSQPSPSTQPSHPTEPQPSN